MGTGGSPANGLWIAAFALEDGLAPATPNGRFSALESLRWERW